MQICGNWLQAAGLQRLCAMLEQAGYQALLVGGCVRNALLGQPVTDIDIASDARPETVSKLGVSHGFKVVPTGLQHGTVTLVWQGIPHEVTTFRRDVKTDGRHAVVAFSDSVESDARRRDFTMNALYARADGTVLDPLLGLPDLQAGRVRFIGNPHRRIAEDHLRSLRFFRFHAWYGNPDGGLDSDGLAAIAENLGGLAQLSRERVGAEMLKLLAAPNPAQAVAGMRACGVLGQVLPGASDHALGLLVHHEETAGIAPNALRRLALLGGENTGDLLRLSKAQARQLQALKGALETQETIASLAFYHGAEMAVSVALLRAAMFEQPFDGQAVAQANLGAQARFPLSAGDLMPRFSGPELGQRLRHLQTLWVQSGFTLSRDALLALA